MFKKVAITGGLSSGKSSVCRLFQELGSCVVNADEIVHQLLSPNTSLGQKIISLVGSESVSNHTFDRSIIAMKVFQDPQKLRALEAILHPEVKAEINRLYEIASKEGKYRLFIAEVPLLFEAGMAGEFDAAIAVVADPELCLMRYLALGHSEEDFRKRSAQQLSQEQKAALATYVIHNSGNLEETRAQVESIFSSLAA